MRMNRRPGPTLEEIVAVHEAGHAAAEWLLGCCPYAVHLIPPGGAIEDRKGRMVRDAGGCCETGLPYNILLPQPAHAWLADRPDRLADARRYGLAAAAANYAGPVAEARHRRLALVVVTLTGGGDDMDQVSAIAADLYGDAAEQQRFDAAAVTLARHLLRGGMPAVLSLAGELRQARSLDGDRLWELLTELLGPKPAFLGAVRWCAKTASVIDITMVSPSAGAGGRRRERRSQGTPR